MRILVLGGTIFLGRWFVEAARKAGHELTLFHRGEHGEELFPDVERILGDRRGGLDRLSGRAWDAVLDTCGYLPADVRASAEALAGCCEVYAFISTISVYETISRPGLCEDDPREELPEGASRDEITPETYGPLKALCEDAVQESLGERALVVRPGLIVGPWDPGDRFTWWVHRMALGGRVPAPCPPERTVQVVDVRDLAGWILAMLEGRRGGVFHATGEPTPMREILTTCRSVTGGDTQVVWVPEGRWIEADVEPYREVPLWYPGGEDRVDVSRARAAGFTTRPLEETVRAVRDWIEAGRARDGWRAGMDPATEARILEASEG